MFAGKFKRIACCSAALLPICSAPIAAAEINGETFDLGRIEQVTVTGTRDSLSIGESRVINEDFFRFGAVTLDKALDLVSGAVTSPTGGTRNEKLFFIRGFDRFEAPLYVDGIRIYLPADNRLDVSFFNTANLSEIQVEKGYVSVLDGPGGMGGAVNMVTRKPTENFEYSAIAGAAFGNDAYDGYTGSATIGSRQKQFYVQASGTITKYDHTDLSDDFVPNANENGSALNHSSSRNYGLNLKTGWTPNKTDEYSLSYSGQWGRKEAPYSTVDSVASQKNWTWPYWNTQSLYFLSRTSVGAAGYIKTKAYFSTFLNGLYSFDDATFTKQTLPKSFRSYYSDYAYGGNIEGGYDFSTTDSLKISYFYRRDSHTEWQITYKPALTEPKQVSVEDTHSVALENRLHLIDKLDVVVGGSYDLRHLLEAHDYSSAMVTYPRADDDAFNIQGQLIYDLGGDDSVHFSVSDRSRFPTLFERYSTKFNSTLSNPNLAAERAVNYELGGKWNPADGTSIEGSVYYSHVSKVLQNVPISFCDTTSTASHNCVGAGGAGGVVTSTQQTQNVGTGDYIGFDLTADTRLTDTLSAGLRYNYIDRSLDAQSPNNPVLTAGYHLTGTPNSQLLLYTRWQILPALALMPSIQTDSNRWTTNTAGTRYFKSGSYFLTNFEADYSFTEKLELALTAKNLADVNYSLTYGFPEQGRNFFIALRLKS